jgi:hypothetical protein
MIREHAVSDGQQMHRTCVDRDTDGPKLSDSHLLHLELSIGLFDHCHANSFLGEPIK